MIEFAFFCLIILCYVYHLLHDSYYFMQTMYHMIPVILDTSCCLITLYYIYMYVCHNSLLFFAYFKILMHISFISILFPTGMSHTHSCMVPMKLHEFGFVLLFGLWPLRLSQLRFNSRNWSVLGWFTHQKTIFPRAGRASIARF